MNINKLVTSLFEKVKGWIEPELEEIRREAAATAAMAGKAATPDDVAQMIKDAAQEPFDPAPLHEEITALKEKEHITIEDVKALIEEIQIPEPFDLEAIFQELKELKQVPRPVDGKDGLDIEILPAIPEKSVPRGTYAHHQGGIWKAHAQTHGMSGWSCVVNGIADIKVEMPDERTIAIVVTDSTGKETRKEFEIPVMIHKGVWKEGKYQKGDCVTRFGSVWKAEKETDTHPGDGETDWTLVVKKGRDGSNGKA